MKLIIRKKLYDELLNKFRVVQYLLVFVFQNICSEFEQRWVSKNLHTENLISIGSNTLHNLLRIPWEPGLMRPEMFGKYFS